MPNHADEPGWLRHRVIGMALECAGVKEERNPMFVYIRAVSDNENEKEQWNGKTMHVYARDFSVSAKAQHFP